MTDYTELKRRAEYALEHAHDSYKLPSEIAFDRAATPAAVLALIAENERLNSENKQLILLECHGGTAEAAINLLAERDQLKENEALRKDAERFRRMRAMTLAQIDDTQDEFDAEFDRQIGAAMGKGEQS